MAEKVIVRIQSSNNERQVREEKRKMANIAISNHANKRIKQRVGIKSFNAQVGYVEKAYEQGLRKEDCTGASLRLLEEREEFSNDRDLVLFRDQIFVFDLIR